MKQAHPTGLGEPEVIGKQALFLPPKEFKTQPTTQEKRVVPENSEKRFRMTMEITRPALAIIQQIQSKHRLLTGQALPKWQIINDALILFGRQKEEKYEHSNQRL